MTLHSAKGLEFDVVVIMTLEEGKLPEYRSTTDAKLREDRRLFYVGLTRARHEIHLVYSGLLWLVPDAVWNGQAEWPSRFISEVQQALVD